MTIGARTMNWPRCFVTKRWKSNVIQKCVLCWLYLKGIHVRFKYVFRSRDLNRSTLVLFQQSFLSGKRIQICRFLLSFLYSWMDLLTSIILYKWVQVSLPLVLHQILLNMVLYFTVIKFALIPKLFTWTFPC